MITVSQFSTRKQRTQEERDKKITCQILIKFHDNIDKTTMSIPMI